MLYININKFLNQIIMKLIKLNSLLYISYFIFYILYFTLYAFDLYIRTNITKHIYALDKHRYNIIYISKKEIKKNKVFRGNVSQHSEIIRKLKKIAKVMCRIISTRLPMRSHSRARSHYCPPRRLLAAGFPLWPCSPLLS